MLFTVIKQQTRRQITGSMKPMEKCSLIINKTVIEVCDYSKKKHTNPGIDCHVIFCVLQ
jgi:hypothetical protein